MTALSRPVIGAAALALVGTIVVLDLARAGAPDLFDAPAPIALGSGQAPSGAHCTAQ